jgi:hypothetical protein
MIEVAEFDEAVEACIHLRNCCNRRHALASEPERAALWREKPKISAIFYKVNLQCI